MNLSLDEMIEVLKSRAYDLKDLSKHRPLESQGKIDRVKEVVEEIVKAYESMPTFSYKVTGK